jgi:hypothetical protein
MARGSRISDAKRAEFRAKYLEFGNASAAARAVGLAESTGCDLAREANADPAFVEARRELYARALPEGLELMMGTLRAIQARTLEPDRTPEQLAAIAVENKLKSFSYQNPKPAYAKAVVDGYGKLLAAQKQATPEQGGTQRIEVVFTDSADDEKTGGGESGAPAAVEP